MATTLKCPNPSCPYLFDPSTVPAGVVLACPRCTMRFTLGAGIAGANTRQPAAHPARPTPVPQAPDPQAASPFDEMTPETARADGETGPRLPVRSSRLQTLLLVGVAVIGLAGAGIAVWYKLTQKPEEITPDLSTNFPDRNFAFVEPPDAWSQDGEMLGLVGVAVSPRLSPRQP